ncbi:hypothetical protein CMK12_12225 [Candidatus Poribacteria bacterium]|jgi:hypothetical protein|nr:hypothetical protein [Candidatus Poribacteria bacterium]MDP6960412.1 hypothetical protein [Dehalococcoidia bacterium]
MWTFDILPLIHRKVAGKPQLGYPGPDLTAGSNVARADMSGTVLVEMEIAPDPVGAVQVGRNSTDGGLRWLPWAVKNLRGP